MVQNRADQFKAPSLPHPFGTDEFGRDILSRVIHGARISLLTGAVAVLIGGTVGVPLGLLGGFAGGLADAAIMRVLDFLLAIPAILLAMVIIAILGPGSFNAMLAVGVVSIPSFARLTRASTLSLKERSVVVATRALGVGPAYLMFRTILLNALTPIVVQVAVTAAVAMLLEAALSFLGLGTQPPTPSWGSMLNTGRSFLHQAPWYGLFPGIVITLSVLSLECPGRCAPGARRPRRRWPRRRRGARSLMARYVLLRLIQLLPVLFLASVGVWLMIYLIPGDPTIALLGADVTPEQLARARTLMGLDRPLPVQYALWLGRVVRGNLGVSYLNGLPVTTMLAQRIPVTLQLTLASLVVALAIAAPFGIVSAVRPRSWIARWVTGYNALAMAVPTFWLGILLVLCFGLWLRWLPTSGYVPFWQEPARAVRFLILPAFTLGAYVSAVLARFTRAALLETLYQDYVRTARAKGLGERPVVGMHALRNALLPVVTVVGLQFGAFMGGAVITEAIFDYPGLGRMLLQAILTRDYTVVQGTILFVVVAFVIINLLTDLAYALLDPRIRYS